MAKIALPKVGASALRLTGPVLTTPLAYLVLAVLVLFLLAWHAGPKAAVLFVVQSARATTAATPYPDCTVEACTYADTSDAFQLHQELQDIMATRDCSTPSQSVNIFLQRDVGLGAQVDYLVAWLSLAVNYRRRPVFRPEIVRPPSNILLWPYGQADNCTLGWACYFNMSFYTPCTGSMHDSIEEIAVGTFPAEPYASLHGHLWIWLALMKTFWRPLPHIAQMVEAEKQRLGWEWPIITIMVRRGSTMDNMISKLKTPEFDLMPPWARREITRRNFSHEYGLEPYLRAAERIRQQYGIDRVHLVTDDVPIYDDVAAGKYNHTGFRFSLVQREEVAANYVSGAQPGSQVVRNAEVLAQGTFFIGAFTSCYARLVYQLMLLRGRPHEAAVSVDAPWYAILANSDFGRWPDGGWPAT
jgi:hypothetical protein